MQQTAKIILPVFSPKLNFFILTSKSVVILMIFISHKLLNQVFTKRILGKVTLKLAFLRNRNNACFLRNNDNNSVTYLAETKGSVVSGAKLVKHVITFWQWKNTSPQC